MGQSPKSEFYNKEHKGLPFHQGVGSYGARFVQDDTYSTSLQKLRRQTVFCSVLELLLGDLTLLRIRL